MNNNLNTSKIKKFFKNKNTVTALCAILIVVILVIGYNIRINAATKPVSIPVARTTIQPKTEITSDLVSLINVPSDALQGNYYSKKADVIGKYSNVNTIIPKGSMFYKEALVTKAELPDSSLYDVPEGHTLYYLTVNMLTSYTNSILPGNYIDLYLSTKENDKALVGKLLQDIKVLAVKTSDGLNVFENSDEARTPYVIIFALPEEYHLLLRKVSAINSYSISSTTSKFSRIEIIPVPTTTNFGNTEEEIEINVSSQYLKEYIDNMASIVPEDVTPEFDFDIPDDFENNGEENTAE